MRLWDYPSISIFSPDFSSTVKWSSQTMIRSSQRFTSASSKVSRCAGCCLIKSCSSLMRAICASLAAVSTVHFSRCSRSLKISSAILVVGLFVIGFFEKLFLEFLQSFVNAIGGILLSTTDHLCNVLLELRLVGGLITKEHVDGLNYHILQYRLIDSSCVAFPPGRLQPTDAAPDDGFATAIVPVDSAGIFHRIRRK